VALSRKNLVNRISEHNLSGEDSRVTKREAARKVKRRKRRAAWNEERLAHKGDAFGPAVSSSPKSWDVVLSSVR
jgi:hypothetical protein